jgi:hypothetical protein
MPVFQESTHESCEVTLYCANGPLKGTFLLDGRNEHDDRPSLLSCHTQAGLGTSAAFGFVCKPERGDTFFSQLTDDTWVDIVFTSHEKRWHVMRGLVDEVRRSKQVSGSGATQTTYTVSGRSFQKVFTDTQIYLNVATGENALGDLAQNIANGLVGSPGTLQRNLLTGLLKFLANANRANWQMPAGMPGASGPFYQNFKTLIDIPDTLPRVMRVAPFDIDNGALWSLAVQYSDPMYTEMYCDLINPDVPTANAYDQSGTVGQPISSTGMTVIIRDRPFMQVDSSIDYFVGRQSSWFSLPRFTIARSQIVADDIGKSGLERYNAFRCVDSFGQLLLNQNPRELFTPLWNKSDMLVHGLRRLEVTSSYGFNYRERGSIGESVYRQRRNALLRDWYCLNPQYLSGTLSLATGAPHVRIGGRLYVPAAIPSQNLNFYIEGVSHSWQQPMGTRTQITVTRGYQGTDDAHLADLRAEAAKYTRDGYLGY